MHALRSAEIKEIEQHLIELGSGNHSDNLAQVRAFPRHYLVRLTEEEFMQVVFLQTRAISKIAPAGHDRRLRAVATRATALTDDEMNLGGNWNIRETLIRLEQYDFRAEGFSLPALLLRDTRGSESDWAPQGWYLQDGSHRALAYCVKIVSQETRYQPQSAFCATLRWFDVA
jgi:hypothetical protein